VAAAAAAAAAVNTGNLLAHALMQRGMYEYFVRQRKLRRCWSVLFLPALDTLKVGAYGEIKSATCAFIFIQHNMLSLGFSHHMTPCSEGTGVLRESFRHSSISYATDEPYSGQLGYSSGLSFPFSHSSILPNHRYRKLIRAKADNSLIRHEASLYLLSIYPSYPLLFHIIDSQTAIPTITKELRPLNLSLLAIVEPTSPAERTPSLLPLRCRCLLLHAQMAIPEITRQ
jgi:hypothetical protein